MANPTIRRYTQPTAPTMPSVDENISRYGMRFGTDAVQVKSPGDYQVVPGFGSQKTGDSTQNQISQPGTTPAATPGQASSPSMPTFEEWNKGRTGLVDEDAIREQTRKQMQAAIDAINLQYTNMLTEQGVVNDQNNARVQALNVNSGLAGSNFATSNATEQEGRNKKALDAIRSEQATKLAEVHTKIDEVARAEITARKTQAVTDATAYATQMRDILTQLAQSGADISQMDPKRRAYIFKTLGMDEQLGNLYYDSLKPDQQWVTKVENGYIISSRTNPQTGKPEIQTKALPELGGIKGDLKFAPDGTAFIVPKKYDPTKPLDEQIKVFGNQGQYGKPEDPKKQIVRINGVDYQVDETGNYALPDVPQEQKQASELKTSALKAAQDLLNKVNSGNGTTAVGGTRFWSLGGITSRMPGTGPANFTNDYENLKALLSLDNVKYLKGQGQVSDAERRLLENAASKLNLSQSDPEFKTTLEELIKGLSGAGGTQLDPNDPRVKDLKAKFPDATDEEIRQALGFNGSATGSTNNGVGMRTDRHNNPTAFTTDIAKLAGLREGVDYVTGDPFSGGKYHTAKLLGDPIATTIRVIDRIGFYTQSGNPRWSYVKNIPEAENWRSLSYGEKKRLIGQMYRHEGGKTLSNYFA